MDPRRLICQDRYSSAREGMLNSQPRQHSAVTISQPGGEFNSKVEELLPLHPRGKTTRPPSVTYSLGHWRTECCKAFIALERSTIPPGCAESIDAYRRIGDGELI